MAINALPADDTTLPRNVVLQGHALTVLQTLPDNYVQCVITSPPYYGLRDNKTPPMIWDEDQQCNHVWDVWMENHDVREETQHGKTRTTNRHYIDASRRFDGNHQKHTAGQFCIHCGAWKGELGMEPTPDLYIRHLVTVFREVRRVLCKDGTLWVVIGDSFAGSGKGQGGKDHGKLGKYANEFLPGKTPHINGLKPKDLMMIPARVAIALQEDGWWVRQDVIWNKPNAMPDSVKDRPTSSHEHVFLLTKSAQYYYDADAIREPHTTKNLAYEMKKGSKWGHKKIQTNKPNVANYTNPEHTHSYNPLGRNKRSVWNISTIPYPETHFSVFPVELVETCLKAGSRPGDIALDPFMGSGTTAAVAIQHQRDYIGIEVNPAYFALIEKRITAAKGGK